MNDARLLDRLAKANAYAPTTPLPDEIWTRELSLREIERRFTMKPTELTKQSTSHRDTAPRRVRDASSSLRKRPSSIRPGRRGVTAAAALLVLFAGIGIWISTAGDPDVTADDALAAGSGFVEAFNLGDAAGALAYLGPEASISQTYIGMSDADDEVSRGFFERELAWYAAQGGEYTNPQCSVAEPSVPSAPTLTVFCKFGLHGAAERAAGKGPVATNLTIVVGPDGIVELAYVYPPSFGVGPFNEWVESNHPEDAANVAWGDWATVEEATRGGSLIPGYVEEWLADLDERGCRYWLDSIRCASPDPAEAAAAVALADAYIAAFNAGDFDRLLELAPADTRITEKYIGVSADYEPVDRAFFERQIAWDTAQGSQFTDSACRATGPRSGGVEVICEFGWLNAQGRIRNRPVATTMTFLVTADGISQLSVEYPALFGIRPFQDWMAANHRDDARLVLFGNWATVEEARTGGALTEGYLEDWLADLAAQGCDYFAESDSVGCGSS